jgi:hypothetical protein
VKPYFSSIQRFCRSASLTWSIAAGGGAVGAGPAAAQIDYRNTDDDRPTVLEDAYAVGRYAFEVQLPYRYEDEADGAQVHLTVPELKYGLLRNAHVGVKFPIAGLREPAIGGSQPETDWGLAGIRLFGFNNFFTEGRWLPALSLRTDVSLPVGSLAGDETQVTLRGILTRTWGRNRLHVNVARTLNEADELAAAEPASRWLYGLAYDRTLFRQSILLLAEVYGLQGTSESRTQYNATVGARYQFSPTIVLDLGVARRLRSGVGPDFAVTAGVSHAFAVPWLIPVPRR